MMMNALSRTGVKTVAAKHLGTRMLSSQGTVAVEKLRCVLENYREQNFRQTFPGRFRKQVLQAATGKDDPNHVCLAGIQRVLSNIGAPHALSQNEMKTLFAELGNSDSMVIPSQRMAQII